MTEYHCECVKEICKEGSRQELLHALRMALVEGQIEDVTSWHVRKLGEGLFSWSGALTISSAVFAGCRRDALREFLFNAGVPEDVAPSDVVVTEVNAAVELEPAATTIPVPEGIRAVPRHPDREFAGLCGAGE